MSLFKELAGIGLAAAVAAAGATAMLPWFETPRGDVPASGGPYAAAHGDAGALAEAMGRLRVGMGGGASPVSEEVPQAGPVAAAQDAEPSAGAMASQSRDPAPAPDRASASVPEPAPEPADPRWVPTPMPEIVAKADALFDNGDVAGARLWLELALERGDAQAAFRLAETYDPATLAEWRAIGVASDPERARALYERALNGGVEAARERLGR